VNIIYIYNLYRYNYSVDVVNSLRQTWYTRNIFSCIGHPKDRDMLCYLDNCDAEYTLKSGETLWAKSGNIWTKSHEQSIYLQILRCQRQVRG